MKMKLRKLLALILALMMTICVFAACGEDVVDNKDDEKVEEKTDKKEEPVKKISDEDAVRSSINKFADLYFSGDEKALEYIDKDAEGYEDVENGINEIKAMEAKFTELAENFGLPEQYNKRIEELVNKFADGIFEKMKIIVNDVEVDGYDAVATCDFENPNFNEMDSLMSEDALNEAMMTAFTEEEIEALNYADEEAQAEASVKLIEALFNMVVEKIDVVSETIEYNLSLVDGRWIITGKN